MHVAAIVTIPSSTNSAQPEQSLRLSSPIATWDLLGESILSRILARIRVFGIGEIAVISEDIGPRPEEGFWPEWDKVVSKYLNHGLQTLLLIRVGAYIEIDLADLLRFHRDTLSPLTQVYGDQRPLDLVAVEAAQLREGSGSFRNRLRMMIPKQQRYSFTGYTNRLRDARDFRLLAKDALMGLAAIRPIGTEVKANVWLGEGARVDSSAVIDGPAYIGKRTIVRQGATVSGASAIESNCEIDFATRVDDSCILSDTFIGAGLRVRDAVVGEQKLIHLGRGVSVALEDSKLIGTTGGLTKILKDIRGFRNADTRVACQPEHLVTHL